MRACWWRDRSAGAGQGSRRARTRWRVLSGLPGNRHFAALRLISGSPHAPGARERVSRSRSRPRHPGWRRCSSVTYQSVCSLVAPSHPGASTTSIERPPVPGPPPTPAPPRRWLTSLARMSPTVTAARGARQARRGTPRVPSSRMGATGATGARRSPTDAAELDWTRRSAAGLWCARRGAVDSAALVPQLARTTGPRPSTSDSVEPKRAPRDGARPAAWPPDTCMRAGAHWRERRRPRMRGVASSRGGAGVSKGVGGVGWPREITLPGLPQIRTCGIPASGSSGAWSRRVAERRVDDPR